MVKLINLVNYFIVFKSIFYKQDIMYEDNTTSLLKTILRLNNRLE
jgi:hypothetical protein